MNVSHLHAVPWRENLGLGQSHDSRGLQYDV